MKLMKKKIYCIVKLLVIICDLEFDLRGLCFNYYLVLIKIFNNVELLVYDIIYCLLENKLYVVK